MKYPLITQFQNYRISGICLFLLFTILPAIQSYSQNLNYSHLEQNSETFQNYLAQSGNYFSGGSSSYPYFQGKTSNSYIKFYRSTGTTCIIDLKSEQDFISLVRKIQRNANFRFKYCTDYNEPIVYNYETYGGNKIRFNFNDMRISVEYPSKLNSFIESNSEFTSVFVCLSNDAYAYHTNLRCEGLGNCDTKIAKSNIKEAKKYNYRICEICTDDDY